MSTVTAATPDSNALRKQPVMLKPGDFEESAYAFADCSARVPAGMPFEEVLRPGFWTNVVHLFQRNLAAGTPDRSGAIIHVRTEDHAYYAKLYVRAVLSRGLIVQCVGPLQDPKTGKACPVDLATGRPWSGPAPVKAEHFDIKWNVGKRGFDIIRKSDHQVVGDGSNFPIRELALEWIQKTTGAN